MGKLKVSNFITLNGYFQGPNGDLSWAHQSREDEYAFEMLKGRDRLLFGRVTYEVMKSYWPTLQAMKDAPLVAHYVLGELKRSGMSIGPSMRRGSQDFLNSH